VRSISGLFADGRVCLLLFRFFFFLAVPFFFIETQSDASFSGRNGGEQKMGDRKNPKAKQLYLAISDTMWCGGKLPLICIRLIFVFLISIFVHTFEIDWLETEIKPPVRCITITTHKQNSFG
jgi:hypothetical protein